MQKTGLNSVLEHRYLKNTSWWNNKAKAFLNQKWDSQKVLRRLQICSGASPRPLPRQQTTRRPAAWRTGSCRCAWAKRDPGSVGAVAGFAWTWQEEEEEEVERGEREGTHRYWRRRGGGTRSVHWEADCDSRPDSHGKESKGIWKWNEEELGESERSVEKGESH